VSGADRLEDGFAHGTVEGYQDGCRGGWCPAGEEHGLSCKRAKQLSAGDYRYQKLTRRGMSPFQISLELGLTPETHAAPVRKVAVPDDGEDDVDVVDGETDGEDPVVEKIKEAPSPKDVASKTKRKSPAGPSQAEVRAWAKSNGVEVNQRGTVRADVVQAYLAAQDGATRPAESPLAGAVRELVEHPETRTHPVVVDLDTGTVEAASLDVPNLSLDGAHLGTVVVDLGVVPDVRIIPKDALGGATAVPVEGARSTSAGEFAAKWNSLDPEDREKWVRRIEDNADDAIRCFQADHEAAVDVAHRASIDARRAHTALELALRAWDAERTRRLGQSALLRSMARQVVLAEAERRFDGDLLHDMDRALAEAQDVIEDLRVQLERARATAVCS